MRRNFTGPPVIKDEIRAAIIKMKSGNKPRQYISGMFRGT